MPATAGRVRMPTNNRVHSSAALQTHAIWTTAIHYDPYGPNKEEQDAENAYANYQDLLALARITTSNTDESRGACKRCGRVGHLSFQCRNFLSVKEENEKGPEAIEADVGSELGKLKGGNVVETDSDQEEDEESESSNSDYNSEIERLIAQRFGKNSVRKEKSKKKNEDSDVADSGEMKNRGRPKKRRSSKRKHDDSDDSEEDRKKRRKEKRRNLYSKTRKEKSGRRSHRYSDDSESDASEDSHRHHSRRSRRAATPSDSDASGSDDSRVGRGRKRSEKRRAGNTSI